MVLFKGFYQMGFVARDLDAALPALTQRYGIGRFRRRQANEFMSQAHAYVGDLMIELIAITRGGPALYEDYVPARPDAIRLHHHGFLVANDEEWAAVNRQVEALGLDTPLKGAAMDGHLNYLYVDTRADLGIYSEYIYLTGPARQMYDDIPRN